MYDIVEVCTSLLEFFGIVVLVTSAVRAFIRWVRRDRQNIRLDLAQGIALALEFKMGGEILRPQFFYGGSCFSGVTMITGRVRRESGSGSMCGKVTEIP